VARAFLALLSTLIIGGAAATWKSYGDGVSRMIAGLVTHPVVASSQPGQSDKPEVAAQPAPTAVRAEATTAAPDRPAPAVEPVPATPSSVAPASPDSTQLLQSMTRDLATLGQQVEELKADMAQMKANQQQVAHNPARASEPAQRPKPSVLPRPIASQTRRPVPPIPSYGPPQAAATQPAVPQVATAPYRSAPQAAASPPMAATPYYVPPQRYVPPPSELPPQAAAAPPVDQDSWAPRPPMPLR